MATNDHLSWLQLYSSQEIQLRQLDLCWWFLDCCDSWGILARNILFIKISVVISWNRCAIQLSYVSNYTHCTDIDSVSVWYYWISISKLNVTVFFYLVIKLSYIKYCIVSTWWAYFLRTREKVCKYITPASDTCLPDVNTAYQYPRTAGIWNNKRNTLLSGILINYIKISPRLCFLAQLVYIGQWALAYRSLKNRTKFAGYRLTTD